MFRRRDRRQGRAVVATVEGLEGRRLLAGEGTTAGWGISNLSVAGAEVRAGEELRLQSFELTGGGGSGWRNPLAVAFGLSRDEVVGNADDVWVDGFSCAEEAATIRAELNMWVPTETAAGAYRVVAKLFAGDGTELGTAVGPEVNVTAGGPVDLRAAGVSAGGVFRLDGPFLAGGTMPVSAEVYSTEWRHRQVDVQFALSADDVAGNADDILLGDFRELAYGTNDPLAICFPTGQPVTIPAGMAAGRYRLVAIVDPENRVDESDEGNNVVIGPAVNVVLPTDVLGAWSISGITLGEGEVRAGGKLAVQGVDLAAGERADNGLPLLVVEFAFSRDGVVGNEDDIPLARRVFDARAGVAGASEVWAVGSEVAAGTYHLVANVAGSDAMGRSRVPYGTYVGPVVEVKEAAPVDLTAARVTVKSNLATGTFAAGGYVGVEADTRTTEFPRRWVNVRFALSADDVAGNGDDIVLGTMIMRTAGGEGPSGDVERWLKIPEGVAGGTYRLVAAIDPDNEVAESDETNNVVVGPEVIVLAGGASVPTPDAPTTVVANPPVEPVAEPGRPVAVSAGGGGAGAEGAVVPTAESKPAARLVAKLVKVRRAGKVVQVLRVTNVGDKAYRSVATLRVAGMAPVKRKLVVEAGRYVDVVVKLGAKALVQKGIRVAVVQ